MITITPDTLANAIRELNERALLNVMTGQLDCFRLLTELERMGIKGAQIGRLLGCGKQTVYGWKKGSIPTLQHFFALAQLYYTELQKGRKSVPDKR